MRGSKALELKHVTKRFGSVVANSDVSLDVYHGEILAVLGENGSGKTTLMNMISGIYFPDEGEIYIDGEKAHIAAPNDAFGYGIGMIHQHFKLVDVFTAAENIVLGISDQKYNLKESSKKIAEIAGKYGFDVDPDEKIYNMSVSEKQTVEILKVLYRGAEILILDEPTAVLTPQETEKLFAVLRRMRDDGKCIIIITHKMHEVLSLSDRVAVLRKGEYVGTVETASTDESQLTEMMVGKKITLNIDRTEALGLEERIIVEGLNCYDVYGVQVLDNVGFSVCGGEILGVAGIAGSGQKELLESIAGLQPTASGAITYKDPDSGEVIDLRTKSAAEIRDMGIRLSFVPEDRLGMGLVGNMDAVDNMMLRGYEKSNIFVDRKTPKKLADKIIEELEVVTPGTSTPVRRLSGGNVQKLLVGREIASAPKVFMAAYPVRGLDINSSYTIYNLLNKQKEGGAAVLFVGEDLDVLLALCDRIMVIASGKITGIVDARSITKEELGLLMTKTTSVNDDPSDNGDRKEDSDGR